MINDESLPPRASYTDFFCKPKIRDAREIELFCLVSLIEYLIA